MDARDAIDEMLRRSGRSARSVSREMGRYPTFLSSTRSSVPRADTLAEVARACGYRLVLVGGDGGEPIEVDG